MNVTELGMAITMAGGFAYTIGAVIQDSINQVFDNNDETEESTTPVISIERLAEEVWFNPGDSIEYRNMTGFIVGAGLNDMVTIMLDNGSIIDVPAGKIRKVVCL